MLPKRVVGELCSTLEFDRTTTSTVVESVIVLTQDGKPAAHYERRVMP